MREWKDNSGYGGRLIKGIFLLRVGVLFLMAGSILAVAQHHPSIAPHYALPIFVIAGIHIVAGYIVMGVRPRHFKMSRVLRPPQRFRKLYMAMWGLIGLGFTLALFGLGILSDIVSLIFVCCFAYVVWKGRFTGGGGGGGGDDPAGDPPGGGQRYKEENKRQWEIDDHIKVQMR